MRRRGEDGVVLPTRVIVASISCVVLAAFAFLVTQPKSDEVSPASTSPKATATAKPSVTVPSAIVPEQSAKKPAAPVVKRGDVYVEVYNNSNIKGLAGQTASKATAVGWNVVGADNWYGTVDASTVYYPEKLKAAARLLGADLGITRLKPALEPMRFDRLTVILTADYQ